MSMQTHGILALHFLISFVGLNHGVGVLAISQKDLEIDRYLKQMNKPAVKTINSPSGDLIDCVDMYKQPSLDHPLLKNHKIQVRNILDPTEVNDPTIEIHQDWHANGECPEGTIPIRRIRKSDILRATSLENYGTESYDNKAHEFSVAYKNAFSSATTFGARADINAWNPRTSSNDFSAAQIWVLSDPQLTRLEAGWHVFPRLYGDNKTRFFTLSTDNFYEIRCYNLICPGFIQTNKEIALGQVLHPLSSYGGPGYQISVKIFKDVLGGGQWWLTFNGKLLGYWPTEIVPALNNGSTSVMWGGQIQNTNHLLGSHTTQMGSGHFAEEGDGKAAFFRNISTLDYFGRLEETKPVESSVFLPDCYDFKFEGGTSNFYYGGPGRNANCH